MTEPQTKTMICLSVAVTVCTIVCFITFLSMTVDPYWVYDRAEGVSFIEFQPQLTARSIMVLYAYDGAFALPCLWVCFFFLFCFVLFCLVLFFWCSFPLPASLWMLRCG